MGFVWLLLLLVGCGGKAVIDPPSPTGTTSTSGTGGHTATTTSGSGATGAIGGAGGAGGGIGGTSPLIAEYLFDGNAQDTSGHGFHGTVFGPQLSTDRFGNADSAYQFDGTSDRIEVEHAQDLNLSWSTDSLTVAAWIYPTATKTGVIVRKGAVVNGCPYSLGVSASGDIVGQLEGQGGALVRKIGYQLNQWTHVAMTWDGNALRLYVDGRLEDEMAAADSLSENDEPLLIGTRLQLPTDTMQGRLDEIRLFRSARTQPQICADAEISGTPDCP